MIKNKHKGEIIMTKKEVNIKDYTYKLLKKKNYFINEIYNKLISKYSREETSKTIKEFVQLELLNDRYLVEMKICYFIHIKNYGKNYIHNYFDRKNVSPNLVRHVLSKYHEDVFLNNIKELKNNLFLKTKSDSYIYNYLLRKGYQEEEIKKICN